MNDHWGFHMMVDAAKCNPASIRDVKHIKKFAKELVKSVHMVAHGEPQVVHFGKGDKEGNTLIQLIETSNITVHFVDMTNDMYFDLFSCRDFDKKIVKDVIMKYFHPEVMHERFLYRDAKCNKNCLK